MGNKLKNILGEFKQNCINTVREVKEDKWFMITAGLAAVYNCLVFLPNPADPSKSIADLSGNLWWWDTLAHFVNGYMFSQATDKIAAGFNSYGYVRDKLKNYAEKKPESKLGKIAGKIADNEGGLEFALKAAALAPITVGWELFELHAYPDRDSLIRLGQKLTYDRIDTLKDMVNTYIGYATGHIENYLKGNYKNKVLADSKKLA